MMVKLFIGILLGLIGFCITCTKNKNPETPQVIGPTEGFVGETITIFTSTIDPDEDSLSYLVDWGDGSFSRWSEYYKDGDTAEFNHKFAEESLYSIRVLAKDINGDTSDWSFPHNIEIFSELNQKWTFLCYDGEISPQPPAISHDGTIYVVLNWILYAIDHYGNLKWSRYFPDEPISCPAIGEDGTIYVGVGNNQFIAFNPDGSIKWSFPVATPTSCAIGSDGTLYLGSGDSCLYAISSGGSFKWSYKSGGEICATPIIGIENIYFLSGDGYYYALSPSGELFWKIKISSTPVWWHTGGAISSDGTIFILLDSELIAIKSDGTIKWCLPIERWIGGSPVIGPDGTIYVLGKMGLYAISQSGAILWRYPGEAFGTPAVVFGNLIIAPIKGEIYLINHKGLAKRKTKIADQYHSGIGWTPAIGNDGTIYDIGCKNLHDALFALQGSAPLANSAWPMYQCDPQHTGRVRQ